MNAPVISFAWLTPQAAPLYSYVSAGYPCLSSPSLCLTFQLMALSLKQPSPAQGSSLSLGARLHSNEAIATAHALSLFPLFLSPSPPSPHLFQLIALLDKCQQCRAISLQFVRHVTARNPPEQSRVFVSGEFSLPSLCTPSHATPLLSRDVAQAE